MQQSCEGEGRQSSGRWSKEQHQRFMYAIMQFGKDWRKVEQYVRTRTSSQVRSHAQKFFNKLEKAPEASREPQEGRHSETEFDLERELNNEQTPSTPMELVSLIRKQSKEDGGKISLSSLKKSLEGQPQPPKQEIPQIPPLPCSKEKETLPTSFKSMSNILSAYEELNGRETDQDESFFISITKKYKKLFKQVEDFDRLIDLHHSIPPTGQHPTRSRKRSFTLPEGNNLEEEALQEKIEEIKKKINPQGKEEERQKRKQQRKQREGRERKDSDSSMQLMVPPLHKLTTIQEQPREEDENMSFRAILSQSHLDDLKP